MNRIDAVDCAKVLEGPLLWTLGCVFVFIFKYCWQLSFEFS